MIQLNRRLQKSNLNKKKQFFNVKHRQILRNINKMKYLWKHNQMQLAKMNYIVIIWLKGKFCRNNLQTIFFRTTLRMLKKNIILVQQIHTTPIESQDFSTQENEHIDGPFRIIRPSGNLFHIDKKFNAWSLQQNAKYAAFLKQKGTPKQCKKQMWGYFQKMGKFINTRNTCQCKSHHTKMFKAFKSAQKVIKNLTDIPGFEQLYYQETQKIMDFNQWEEKLSCDQKNKKVQDIEPKFFEKNKNISNDLTISPTDIKKQTNINDRKYDEKLMLPTNESYEDDKKSKQIEIVPQKLREGVYPLLHMERRKQQVYQCHYYFIKWMNKVKSLITSQMK